MTFPWRPHSLAVFLNQDNWLFCRQPNIIDPFDKGWNTVLGALYTSHVQPQDSYHIPLSRHLTLTKGQLFCPALLL
jgi:hypothetical protein